MVEDIATVAVKLEIGEAIEDALERRDKWIAEQAIEAYDDGKDYLDVLTETGVLEDSEGIRESPLPPTYANPTNEDKPEYPEGYRTERYYLNEVEESDIEKLRNEVEK